MIPKRDWIARGLVLAVVLALAAAPLQAAKKVNLNTASEKELEDLPGVGPATAKKIVDGRPYSSIDDLARAGVPAATIDKIRSQITVGRGAAKSEKAAASKTDRTDAKSSPAQPAREEKTGSKSAASAKGPVDLNTASQKELEELPGVGAATAKKIIANRPYTSVADLSRAKVSEKTIQKISSLVTVSAVAPSSAASSQPEARSGRATGGAPAAAPPSSSAPSGAASSAPAASASRSTSASETAGYQPPPAKGMVWVNLDTKVYHREGDRWYGRTKHGQYMTEADAMKAGYRVSKEKGEPAAK